jgi:hypothetical protein
MVKRTRDFGVLLAALAALIAGIVGLRQGGYNYFGATQVTGGQAQLAAWLSIAFALAAFFLYFRRTRGGP